MSSSPHPLYEASRAVAGFASVILCHNPGPMELEGTNTWILRAPGADTCVVIDPGPADNPAHADAVADACSAGGGRVEAILITHRHDDHTGGINLLVDRTGAPVRAWSAEFCRGAEPVRDREVVEAAGLRLTVLHTPGHTADSVSYLVEHDGERVMVTGDTILGRGSPLLDPADGTLRDYLGSLDLLIREGSDCAALPGHGPDRPDLAAVARQYKRHRAQRLGEIRRALDEMELPAGRADPGAVVRMVYTNIDRTLWPAACMSVRVHLDYLAQH